MWFDSFGSCLCSIVRRVEVAKKMNLFLMFFKFLMPISGEGVGLVCFALVCFACGVV